MNNDNIEQETDINDIDATVEAIREAWKKYPDISLSQLIDCATPMPFTEMTNEEFREALNEFILQS